MSVWKASVMTPYAAPIDSRLTSTALTGTTIDRNASTISTNDVASTTATIYPEVRRQPVGEVGHPRGEAAELGARRAARPGSGRAARWSRRPAGRAVGVTVMTAAEPSGESCAGDTAATPSVAASSSASASMPAWPADLVDVHRDQQRRVRTGAEAVGHQVVRLADGGRLRLVAGVGVAELHAQRRRRERQQQDQSSRAARRPAGRRPVRASRAAVGECDAADSRCPDRRVLRL